MDIRRFFGGSTFFKNKEKGEASSKDSKGISSSKNIKKEQEKESTSKSKENRDDNLKHKDDSEKQSLKRKHKDKIEDIVTKSKSCKKICSDDEDDRVVKAKHKKKDVLSDEDSSDDKHLKQTLKKSPIKNDSVTKNITKKSKTTLTIGESSDEDNDERKSNHKSSTNNKDKNKGIKKSSSHKLFEDEESFNYESKKHCKSENKNSSLHKKSKTKTSFLDDEEDEVFRKKKPHKNKKAKPIRLFDSDSGEEEDPLPSDIYKSKGKHQAVSDSDEENNTHIKSPSAIETLFKNQPVSHNKKQKKEEDSPKLVEVSVTDFFGSGPVQRSCRNTVAVKRKGAPIETKPSRRDDIDKEFHDDDFEATLKQLDEGQKAKKRTGEEKKKKEKRSHTSSPKISPNKKVLEKSFKTETTPPPSESSPKKSTLKTEEDSISLSNKLSSRFRAQRERKESEVTPTSSQSPCKKFKKEQSYSSPVSKSSSKEEISLSKKKSDQEQSSDIIKETPPKDRNDKKSKALPNRAKEQAEISNSDETSDKAKRRAHFLSYKSYLNREGPQALGSREIPEGAENCMEGMTFVVTGVLESLERDQVKELIERHGGKVTQSLSKNTTYLVIGREPGPSKIDKAVKLRTKQLDEDGLIELVKTLPGKKSKYEPQNHPAKNLKESSELSSTSSEPSQATIEESSQSTLSCSNSQSSVKFTDSSLLWVDKYKPQNLKQIIGQQGDKSCANKLLYWLKNWQKNNSDHTKKKQGFFYKSEDGSNFKAALLSGPPGIGKTTTATLVCQELKFSYIELNASDTRSKKSLKQEVAEALSSHTLSGFFTETSELSSLTSTKHALLMDEVDGMAGNEDRGGIQEVIALIKNTKIPIICMCNDRNHPKIRSLVNYCFDLRFQRPRIEQIKGPIMSIAFKESLKIPPPALQEIIVASNHDIRQILHNLSVWSAKEKSLTFDQAKSNARMAKKDLKLGPFDVARKVFVGGQETAHMNIHDKSDLFFHDYSIAPLFVQENYVMVQPYAARGDIKKHLDLLSQCADSICDGDLVDKLIRTNGSWNLLPVEAIFASVVPGELMKGSITQMINFPSWLGKNSRQGKVNRILQELHLHTSLKISGSKLDLNLDYLNNLKNRLTSPLIECETDGIDSVLDVMKEYSFIREDIDNILEIALWPGQKDPFTSVNSKVKAAFTRAYNKEIHLTPFSMSSNVKKGRRGTASNEDNDNYGVEEDQAVNLSEHEASENELENDGMIKAKKKPTAKKSKDETQNASTSKGKGRGKGKR